MTSGPGPSSETVVELLERAGRGELRAAEELLPLVYGELRRLAQFRLAALAPGQTLQATALVHEAYLRLVGREAPGWEGQAQFFRSAAGAIRDVLVDRLRAKGARKRGEGRRTALDEGLTELSAEGPALELLDLDEALQRLKTVDPRKAEVVTLRFFGGLGNAEVAAILGVSEPTVERDWRYARAWLQREMHEGRA